MKNIFRKKIVPGLMIVAGLSMGLTASASESILKVTATSTLFADLAKKIGGDRVEVESVASPRFNVHFYQPTPSDIRKVRKADLYIHWGLDIEAWSDPLLEAAGKSELFRGSSGSIDLSQNINLLNLPKTALSRSDGDIHLHGNPHYQMNPQNMKTMATTLTNAFIRHDSRHAGYYLEQLKRFVTELDLKIKEWKQMCERCQGQELISYHDDTVYLADFLGVTIRQFVEPKPGIPPTPQHLAFIQEYLAENRIQAVTVSTYYPKKAVEKLAQKVGAQVIVLLQNAGELPGTEGVFDFYEYNIRQIAEVFNRG